MATFHRRLSDAGLALSRGDFKSASTLGLDALALDDRSYDAHLWAPPETPLPLPISARLQRAGAQ